jgi:glycosyltransferase involved in cell wall biosynthesis
MQDKLVSIIIPTYNRADLIGETIQSVIDQTYTNWELIVVDDGSSDNTSGLLSKFNNSRIRYYAIEHCGILGKVRNVGMSHATGEYIAFLDSDDIWLPEKLEYQLSLLNKYPQASFVFGHGEQFGLGAIPPPELETLFSGNIFLPLLLEERFVFYVPTVLFKKENLKQTGLINESLISGGDINFFLRMGYRFDGIFSNTIVVKIRKHKQSHSSSLELVAYEEYLKMIKKFHQEKLLTSGQFNLLASKQYYKLGFQYLNKGNAKKAIGEFLKYINLNPLRLNGWFRLAQSVVSCFNF